MTEWEGEKFTRVFVVSCIRTGHFLLQAGFKGKRLHELHLGSTKVVVRGQLQKSCKDREEQGNLVTTIG